MRRSSPLQRRTPLRSSTPLKRSPSPKRRRPISESSPQITPAQTVESGTHKAPPRRANDRGHGTEGKTSMQGDRTGARPLFRLKRCAQCATEFMPNVGHQKYCCRACCAEANKREFVCEECGCTFRAEWRPERRFCGDRCAALSRARDRKGGTGRFGKGSIAQFPRPAKCVHCGETYAQNSRGQKYCCRRCNMEARHQRNRTGRAVWHLKSKGEEACRGCGSRAAHLHHIVPRSRSRATTHDIDGNGLPLCRACHFGWHHRTVTIHNQSFTDREFATVVREAGSSWVERNYPDSELAQLIALDHVRRGYWLKHIEGHEPMRLRALRLLGEEWVPERRIVGLPERQEASNG